MKGYFSPGGFVLRAGGMRYREFDFGNPSCLHVVLSGRAYAGVLAQSMRDGRPETGGVFLGRVHNRIWYVVEAVPLSAEEAPLVFRWEPEEVGRLAEYYGGLYREPLEVLGFWHRHSARMDYFSPEDEQILRTGDWPRGQLAMLVNADPDLRMSFYCCNGDEIMPVEYDHGDEYFLEELLACPDPETLTARYQSEVRVRPHRDLEPEQLPRSLYHRPDSETEQTKQESGQTGTGQAKQESGQTEAGQAKQESGQTGTEQAKQKSGQTGPGQESARTAPTGTGAAEGEALARELMRRLEEITARMPSSYMMRLRDQNERILALLEELLREELLRELTSEPASREVSRILPETEERPARFPELPEKEEGEISGRINDLRVKYATEGGRRGWGV